MSTKQQTNSTNSLTYNPGSLGLYGQLTSGAGSVLQQYMSNPFNNGYFNLGQGMGQAAAQKQGGNNMNALLQNMKTSGMGGNAGNAFQMAQMGKIGRGTASMGAQSTMGNVQGALGRQMSATQMGMMFNPLLTGQSGQSTQTQSGLGTWLPQLLGSLGGAAMGAATGGMSSLGGMAAKTATSAGSGAGAFGSQFGFGGGLGSGFTPGSGMSAFAPNTGGSPINPLNFAGSGWGN